MKTNTLPLWRILTIGALLLAFVSSASAKLQNPKPVATALRVLNQVVNHTGRLVASKDYDKVAGEHSEFVEGAEMLRDALRGEPAEFVGKVNTALDAAVTASDDLGKIAASNGAKAEAAHTEFAAKTTAVIELFPEEVRPKPHPTK
ncbi:hypothetical protein DB347_00140 [Opitutaceae bacterium EW11]|nr:hypothetical protein DB347_00140 [Opitutaceae bacterium EW11]